MRKINRGVLCLFLAVFLGLSVSAWAQAPQGETTSAVAQTTDQTVQTSRGVVQSVGEATTEVGGAFKAGSTGVVQQSRGLWRDVLVPMRRRFADALPLVIKAIILLAAFWIIARLAGSGVLQAAGADPPGRTGAERLGDGGLSERPRGTTPIAGISGRRHRQIGNSPLRVCRCFSTP